jgi:threonine dehydrogenase-like Zn-dependent dehydrogenase
MREVTYVGDRRVGWQERPDPELESRLDAIVKPVAATTCDVDKTIIAGRAPVPPPFAIGHECVAEALDLAPSGRVDPGKVVSDILDWETVPEELLKLHTKPVRDPVELADAPS